MIASGKVKCGKSLLITKSFFFTKNHNLDARHDFCFISYICCKSNKIVKTLKSKCKCSAEIKYRSFYDSAVTYLNLKLP